MTPEQLKALAERFEAMERNLDTLIILLLFHAYPPGK